MSEWVAGRGAVLFRLFQIFAAVSVISAASSVEALSLSKQNTYYGSDFYSEVASGKKDKDLIATLRKILESRHLRNDGEMDTVGAQCDAAARDCYQHRSVGYSTARKYLMGQLHLEGTSEADYSVRDVYCEREYTNRDLGRGIGPGRVPSANVINTEHTWPQSRFNGSMSKDTQKSDLHHLFPTHSEMNSIRGNHKFGEVTVPDRALPCPTAKFGSANGTSEDVFEPPTAHKGNVARSLFYFSVRYKLAIQPSEEAFLRKWHRLDPVDADEAERNHAIFLIQGNRNPFIDHPELVDLISDF
ncbi:MAG: endonuclease [Bdellovibrionales bacterium]|jgi:endonuclease I|nr:endonuclease [Bdellovibrionales bacterium]